MSKRKPHSYWKNLEYILAEARRIMKVENWNKLPSHNTLIQTNYSNLTNGIIKYHGGFHNFRKALGETSSRGRMGSWKSLEFTLDYARNLLSEHPEYQQQLPQLDLLQKIGESSLGQAIIKYHGGFRRFRDLLGEDQKKREHGVWKNLKFTIQQAQQFLKEHPEYETLPESNILSKLGYSSFAFAISKYHGGFPNFRRALGESSSRIKMGSWKSLEFTLEQARDFLKKHPEYEALPNKHILCQQRYSSLSKAIQDHHGGYPAFRETLHQHMTGKSSKQELEELLESYAGDVA